MMASKIPTVSRTSALVSKYYGPCQHHQLHGKETEASDSLDDVPVEELICPLYENYHKLYKEIGPLGKGNFGTVVKAQHRLDKNHYAVKKIYFKPDHVQEGKNQEKADKDI